MATVIEREFFRDGLGFTVDIKDHPSTHKEADAIAGKRLDRRKNYAIIDGEVCELAEWSQACSGCYEGYYSNTERGGGCHECGYQGRVRRSQWVPLAK